MNIKLISAGAGTFAFGALVGWALTADYFENRLKEQAENERIKIDRYRSRLNREEILRENAEALVALNGEKAPEDVSDETEVTDDDDEVSEEKTEEIRSNLQGLIDKYTSDPDVVEAFVDTSVRTLNNDRTPPFVISRAKYSWDEEEGDDYSKITLTYYRRHRILLDEDDEAIDDVAGTVGWKSLSQFGGESEDPNVVFVRNRRLLTDFEVVLDEENEIPLHIKYGMGKEEFNTGRAAGIIRLRAEDRD